MTSRGRKVLLGDPMEIALVETAERFLSALPACKKLDEIPFDVSSMRLSTVHATPEGPMLFCKSAPEMVIPLCDRILADGEIRPFDSGLRAKVRQAQEAMAGQGGHVVAATGDGVNDAPALKSAHIGIAMGIAGTDVAKEAADMVLLDDNFASIVNAVEEGRAVFSNIRKFLTYILAHNVPELISYLVFSLFSVPLALTPIQILSIDMGTDSLTALGLGVEKPDPRLMQRPPRSQHQRLFDWPLALRAYLFLGAIEAAITMAASFFVLHGGGWRYGRALAMRDPLYLRATTACFSAIVVLQIMNVFLCRSATRSIFSTGILGNPLIWGGVIVEIALVALIGYTPVGNSIFATAPINARQWLFILPFAAVMLVAEEMRKWIVRAS